MTIAECYQILGLRSGASYRDIKEAYRRLAREYHPDMNTDKAGAEAQFIQLSQAYQRLLAVVPTESRGTGEYRRDAGRNGAANGATRRDAETSGTSGTAGPTRGWESRGEPQVRVRVQTPRSAGDGGRDRSTDSGDGVQYQAPLSEIDRQLKHQSYHQLRSLLQNRRFPRAIALVEGLSQRLPQDREVRQWQAITYQRWGRQLIQEKQYDKARVYLKKALKADPHNKSLWLEVEKEFQKLERVY